MNRRKLEEHLRAHGCKFLYHGGEHDVWYNPATERKAPVPRHRVVKIGTVRSVCRTLQVPMPSKG